MTGKKIILCYMYNLEEIKISVFIKFYGNSAMLICLDIVWLFLHYKGRVKYLH